ncbi:nicotinate phosphoribosyltransferase [Salisaeta longa]|uniref:nicotinate phosphoribosyltransferase n=1 Tax=Salisaeta longa TaxID=503170 RepID=UPI0003B63751|nr:nicotinate phosphoribosyltransferase [Salisaeta longa]
MTAMPRATSALHTDLYQLTMLRAYQREGMQETAVFDLFVRRLKDRGYLVAAGLETVLDFLEGVGFTSEDQAYLRSLDDFDDAFVDGLADFSFTGDVYAVPEGTPVFPEEPLLEVVAPIGEAQLVETYLLNQMTLQTTIASKAARVVQAATADGTDRLVADFGMRRAQGLDAALKGARAAYIAGVDATSNVAAGQAYGLPVTGTMAHSYIEAHDQEAAAFTAFMDTYPETILLVDTYDTLRGVRKVIDLAQRMGDDFKVRGVRLDSGDLAALAKEARRLLDDAGLHDIQLVASSSLDEYRIAELLADGAPIDGFGVGTRMATSADQPYLDSAYKLSGYDGTPRMKLATDKSNLPGRKQVYRQLKNGTAVQDVIATEEETVEGTPLLQKVMEAGQRVGERPSADALRARCAAATAQLPEALRTLDADAAYPVAYSEGLQERIRDTKAAIEARLATPAA